MSHRNPVTKPGAGTGRRLPIRDGDSGQSGSPASLKDTLVGGLRSRFTSTPHSCTRCEGCKELQRGWLSSGCIETAQQAVFPRTTYPCMLGFPAHRELYSLPGLRL